MHELTELERAVVWLRDNGATAANVAEMLNTYDRREHLTEQDKADIFGVFGFTSERLADIGADLDRRILRDFGLALDLGYSIKGAVVAVGSGYMQRASEQNWTDQEVAMIGLRVATVCAQVVGDVIHEFARDKHDASTDASASVAEPAADGETIDRPAGGGWV